MIIMHISSYIKYPIWSIVACYSKSHHIKSHQITISGFPSIVCYPKCLVKGNQPIKMDDTWGYPHVRTPLFLVCENPSLPPGARHGNPSPAAAPREWQAVRLRPCPAGEHRINYTGRCVVMEFFMGCITLQYGLDYWMIDEYWMITGDEHPDLGKKHKH